MVGAHTRVRRVDVGPGFDTSGDFAFKDQGRTETKGLNGRLEWQLAENSRSPSITDFKDYQKLLFIDVDSAPVNQLANYAGVDATSFTQEMRLSGTSGSAALGRAASTTSTSTTTRTTA